MSDFLKKTFESISNLLKPKNESEQQIISEVKKNPKANNLDVDFIEYLSICIQSNNFELPTIPNIINQLVTLTNNEKASFKMFSDIVKKDPLISLKLLQLANSPLYKGKQEINDIERAISRIGIGGVQSLVISIKIKNILFNSVISQNFASILWKKSILTAIIMGKTIKNINEISDDLDSFTLANILNNMESSYYTLGLLHNIGGFITLSIGNSFLKQHNNYTAEETILQRVINSFEKQITNFTLLKWGFSEEQIASINNFDIKKSDEDSVCDKVMYFAHQISKGVLSGHLKSFSKEEILVFYEKVCEDAKLTLQKNDLITILSGSFKEYQTIIEMV